MSANSPRAFRFGKDYDVLTVSSIEYEIKNIPFMEKANTNEEN